MSILTTDNNNDSSNTDSTDALADAAPSLATKSASSTRHPFHFTGSGGEYFRIWIVNLVLTLLTLGIYSPWAKVRSNRYLYGNTEVANGHFDYHANPLVILRGRIIALVLLLVYLLCTNFFPVLGLLVVLLLLIALPWIVVRSLAFNARNSSWRNIRFSFTGKPGQAAGAYLGWPLLGAITLGLAMPFAWFKAASFGVNNHRLGKTQFQLGARPVDFYVIAMYLLLAGAALIGLFSVLGVVSAFSALGGMEGMENMDPDDPMPTEMFAILVPMYLVMGFAYIALINLFTGLRFKAVYNNLALEQNKIFSTMSIPGFLGVAVTNTLAMLFTLGLFYPWAKVRITRYMLNSLALEAVDIDNFVASAEQERNALGEELGEVFDLGIGV